jgi:hypothetical protein
MSIIVKSRWGLLTPAYNCSSTQRVQGNGRLIPFLNLYYVHYNSTWGHISSFVINYITSGDENIGTSAVLDVIFFFFFWENRCYVQCMHHEIECFQPFKLTNNWQHVREIFWCCRIVLLNAGTDLINTGQPSPSKF